MARKYFGTDGIRGRVGEGAISADFVLRLGNAAGRVLAGAKPHAIVVIGSANSSNSQRLRQYAGDHNETWGGVTYNIDSNVLDGPVAVVPGGPPVSTPAAGAAYTLFDRTGLGGAAHPFAERLGLLRGCGADRRHHLKCW